MDLREAAQEREWQSILPHLREAYLRVMLNPSTLPGLLKNYSPEDLTKHIASLFTLPASPEEAKIRLLADLVISLMFPEKKIDPIIWQALPEIEKAYEVILQRGGGWSSYKSNPDKRKEAVLEWYRGNQARLDFLKEKYLQDPALYAEGGGAEKRNFIVGLVIKIVKDTASKELTFQRVKAHLKNLKNLKGPLRLEEL
ncbi:MAG: hypothetical protein ACUVXF_05990 [Desulfobaccales bacterium]